jgi:O-antigen/teichoic acid export membrane protein
MISPNLAADLVLALLVGAIALTLAGIAYYRIRIRRIFRKNPSLERAWKIKARTKSSYRGRWKRKGL